MAEHNPDGQEEGAEQERAEEAIRVVVMPSQRTVPNFTGVVGTFEDFQCAVRDTWRVRGIIGTDDRVRVIWEHLGEEVRDEIRCHPEDARKTPAQIFEILGQVYGDRRTICQLLTTFNAVVQRSGEPVRSYSRRLNRAFQDLGKKQRAEGQQPMGDQVLRDQFIQGLQDKFLAKQLREGVFQQGRKTFFDVREEALRWVEGDREVGSTTHPQATVAATHSTQEIAELLRSLAELRTTVASLEQRMGKEGEGKELPGSSQYPRGQPRRRKPEFTQDGQPICFGCKQPGHMRRQCPGNGRPRQ